MSTSLRRRGWLCGCNGGWKRVHHAHRRTLPRGIAVYQRPVDRQSVWRSDFALPSHADRRVRWEHVQARVQKLPMDNIHKAMRIPLPVLGQTIQRLCAVGDDARVVVVRYAAAEPADARLRPAALGLLRHLLAGSGEPRSQKDERILLHRGWSRLPRSMRIPIHLQRAAIQRLRAIITPMEGSDRLVVVRHQGQQPERIGW